MSKPKNSTSSRKSKPSKQSKKSTPPPHKRPRRAPSTPSPEPQSPSGASVLSAASVLSDAPNALATPDTPTESPSDPFSTPPPNPDALHAWIARYLGFRIARVPLIDHHAAPFDYLCHTFFEGAYTPGMSESSSESRGYTSASPLPSSPDCTVWANRGGGKTFLGAIATLLDLLFKPGCQVRILAGSLEQGQRMYDHLRSFLENDALHHIPKRITARRIALTEKKSAVEILAASQTSVRGTRVQKLRCDEVDLFDPQVWSAAQLVTRSLPGVKGPWGPTVRGSVEALSTMHKPFGLMWKLVGDPNQADSPRSAQSARSQSDSAQPHSHLNVAASSSSDNQNSDLNCSSLESLSFPLRALRDLRGESSSPRNLFRWGLLDVLEHCPPERECAICPLEPECQGRAKFTPLTCEGHITIDDAVSMKFRVGRDTWESEMLCLRPSRSSAVYPEFSPNIHVRPAVPPTCRFGHVGDVATTASTFQHAPHAQNSIGLAAQFVHMIAGMDFGYRSESVILLAGITRSGAVHVIREYCKSEQVLAAHIDALDRWRAEGLFRHRTELGDAPPIDFVGIDPAGNAIDHQTGKTSSEFLTSRGYKVRYRQSDIYPGLSLVRDRLNPAWSPPRAAWGPKLFRGDAFDPPSNPGPRLLIDPCCTRLIECLSRYHFDESKPESLVPEKDGFDHACDALRYMLLNLDRPYTTEFGNYARGAA